MAGGYGYSVKKSIVYAYLPIDYSKPGTKLEIEFFGEHIGAVVVSSPLLRSEGRADSGLASFFESILTHLSEFIALLE